MHDHVRQRHGDVPLAVPQGHQSVGRAHARAVVAAAVRKAQRQEGVAAAAVRLPGRGEGPHRGMGRLDGAEAVPRPLDGVPPQQHISERREVAQIGAELRRLRTSPPPTSDDPSGNPQGLELRSVQLHGAVRSRLGVGEPETHDDGVLDQADHGLAALAGDELLAHVQEVAQLRLDVGEVGNRESLVSVLGCPVGSGC